MKCLLQNQAHANTTKKEEFAYAFSISLSLPLTISHETCSAFFLYFSVGKCRNSTLENSRPVKRIMSTISKHSEEAEDDEICSGNL